MDLFVLNSGSQTTLAAGSFNIFGVANSDETVILAQPPSGSLDLEFDPSFNTGGDTIAFAGDAQDYTIQLSGSSVTITNGPITATIPVGLGGTNIIFYGTGPIEEGDLRSLRIDPPVNGSDGQNGVVVLGDQVIESGDPAVGVAPLAQSLAFTGSFSTAVPENQTAAFDTDLVGSPDVVFALGGADVGLFSINEQTGIVTFNDAPDFEMPADADGDNVYELSVSASAMGNTVAQDVSITVTDVEETIASDGQIRIATGLRQAIAPTASEENDAGRLNSDGEFVSVFGVAPAITGLVGVDTEIENAPADARIIINGENQTVGQGNNNTSQLFGVIQLEDSESDDLLVEIENTARVDGELIIEELIVNRSDVNDDTTVANEILTINSGGSRETSNIIRELSAGETEDLFLTGSQSLGLVVGALAAGPETDFLIDASALDERVMLGIEGNVLDSGDDDEIFGTDDAADRLALIGTLDAGTNPSINGIENIQFGIVGQSLFGDATKSPGRTVEGEFDFSDVDDINNTITITNLSGALRLINFADDTLINVGDGTAGAEAPITQFNDTLDMMPVNNSLTFNGADSRDAITVNLTPFLGGSAGGLLDAPATDYFALPASTEDFIDINGFEIATLTISRQITLDASASNYALDLRLDDGAGIDLNDASLSLDDDAADFVTDMGTGLDAVRVDGALDQLTILGGQTDREDALDVGNALLGSIAIVDISNYHGTFTGTVVNAVEVDDDDVDSANVDRTFIIGDDDIDITLQPLIGGNDADSIDTNTTFRFTDPTPTSGDVDGMATWTITNFVIADDDDSLITNSDLSNFSQLDFGGLGLSNFSELVIEPDGMGNTIITAEDAQWQVILIDIDPLELTSDSENFAFTGSASSPSADLTLAPTPDPAMALVESFALA